MTRETKIGLLVGLAFIIVIGILLSDHINSSTDPVPAALSQSYIGIDRSLASPDRNGGTVTIVPPPAPVIPQNPVLTQNDAPAISNPGTAKVSIGPGNDAPLRIAARPSDSHPPSFIQVIPPATNDAVAVNNKTDSDNTTTNPDSVTSDPANRLVQENPADLVPVRPPVGVLQAPAPPKINGRQIKAEEGDTVSKLAGRYMGANTKANREAFIKANPSVTPDGHLVFAGRTYIIPSATASTPVAAAGQPAPKTAAPAPIRPGIILYTVKDNDSLWKIAAEQLGSGTRWQEIRDLNKDLLKGSEQVHVNMRLKLPAKAVASTN